MYIPVPVHHSVLHLTWEKHIRQSETDRNMKRLVILDWRFSGLVHSHTPLHTKPDCQLRNLKMTLHTTSPHGIPDTLEQTQYDKAVGSIQTLAGLRNRRVCVCNLWIEVFF